MNIHKKLSIVNSEVTDIFIGRGITDNLTKILKNYKHSSYNIICDEKTEELFAKKIKNLLLKLNVAVFIHTIKPGEKSKNLDTLIKILKSILDNGADRKSAIVALGGGVVGDLATLASGLYYRGIDCIQIPTTLLAMADSSMGGKGAADLDSHKNTLGLIRQPRIIIIDPSFLKSLPKDQIKSGMAEIIKHAISMDLPLFEKLEKAEKIESSLLNSAILHSIKLKTDIIKKDPLDLNGQREILNFGHTLGQAIELLSNLSHGEAVAVGMTFAIKASQKLKMLEDNEVKRILLLIQKYNLPISISGIKKGKILEQILKDKKTIKKIPRFVLLDKIGHGITRQIVPENIINQVLEECIQ